MKVLLKQNIDNLGLMGEVVDVAGGYARNYLIPRGLAVGVTRGRLKEIEDQKKVLEAKSAREKETLEDIARRIKEQPVKITARCSSTGKLFGSVTNRQVAAEIESLTGEEIDRHKIEMEDRVRSVGTYTATIKLHPEIHLDIEFEVEGEGYVAEEPPQEEEGDEQAAGQAEEPEVKEAEGVEPEEPAGITDEEPATPEEPPLSDSDRE